VLFTRRPLPQGKSREARLAHAKQGRTTPVRALEWLFVRLESLSLGHRLSIGANDQSLVQQQSMEDHLLWRLRAASIIDWYILAFLCLEVAAYVIGLGRMPSVLLTVAAGYRLLEIFQVFGNAVLFEQRRAPLRGVAVLMLVSVPRSIAQSVILLIETMLCYGMLFFAARDHLTGVVSGWDALDLSVRTMTTVGTTVQADGALRFLVDSEPLVGLLFAGVVLARLINAMPTFSDIASQYPEWESQQSSPSGDRPAS
jgi:hypothetical protein